MIPTEGDVLAYFDRLSNWDRWGPDDELGTLNLITPEVRRQAARLVRHGIVVGCSRQIRKESPSPVDVATPPLHFMLSSGEDPNAVSCADFTGLAVHGLTITHIDALSHQFWGGRMYNGRPMQLVTTARGAGACSVDAARHGIVTRGVLLDLTRVKGRPFLDPGEPIFSWDLEAAEAAIGAQVVEGDALLVRTGWSLRRERLGPHPTPSDRPGLHAETLPWLRRRGVSVVAADAANDVSPSGYGGLVWPVHSVGMVALGLWLIDNCQFEDLAEACAMVGRSEFLFMVAPARFAAATGSAVTPVAML